MDIPSFSVSGSGVGNLDKWALLQFSRLARQERQERRSEVHDRLSQLLFGVDLNPDELTLYRARLLDAISRVEALENQIRLQPPGDLQIPRSKVMMRVGDMAWLPAKQSTKVIDISPAHQIHSRNIAKTLKTLYSLNPKSVHRSFHAVGIIVAQGSEGTRWGEDRVELSQWGMDVGSSQDYPKIARLRLPPRFPTQAEMVKFRVS